MADFYDEVATHLDGQGIGTYTSSSGRNIFTGHHPSSPDNCVSILGLLGTTIGSSREVASLQFPRFQVVVRNKDYDLGAAKLQAVRTALHGKYGLILPNWRVLRCHADQEGGPIGKDDQGRFEFSINFAAEINAETAA